MRAMPHKVRARSGAGRMLMLKIKCQIVAVPMPILTGTSRTVRTLARLAVCVCFGGRKYNTRVYVNVYRIYGNLLITRTEKVYTP